MLALIFILIMAHSLLLLLCSSCSSGQRYRSRCCGGMVALIVRGMTLQCVFCGGALSPCLVSQYTTAVMLEYPADSTELRQTRNAPGES